MDCKDFLCVLVIYILLEVMKTRFSRENFTRKNNHLNIILQDGDGNIKIMPLKDIYDAIQQAKTSSENYTNNKHGEAIRHTNHKHGEVTRHTNHKHSESIAHTNTKTARCIVRGNKVSLRFANNNYVKAGWGPHGTNVIQDGKKHTLVINK